MIGFLNCPIMIVSVFVLDGCVKSNSNHICLYHVEPRITSSCGPPSSRVVRYKLKHPSTYDLGGPRSVRIVYTSLRAIKNSPKSLPRSATGRAKYIRALKYLSHARYCPTLSLVAVSDARYKSGVRRETIT